jgi:hypothetical protein
VREGGARGCWGDRGRWHEASRERLGSLEHDLRVDRAGVLGAGWESDRAEGERFGEQRGGELRPELRVGSDRR